MTTPAGWYDAPDGSGMRYWDGERWAEPMPSGPQQRRGNPFHVMGYVLAVIFPIVGFIVGIVAATKPHTHPSKAHGVFIILVSVVAFFFWASMLSSAGSSY